MATNNIALKKTAVSDINERKLISKRRRVTLPQWATAWIVLIPALIFLTLFMFFPIINTFISAFIQDFTVQGDTGLFALGQFLNGVLERGQKATFGINNFISVFQLPSFANSIVNTAILTIIEVPLTIIVSLLIATFLNSIKVLKGFYQTIFFLPYVTNTIALGLVFNIAFGKEKGGIVNMVLTNVFGMEPVNFLDAYAFNKAGKLSTKLTEGIVIVTYSLWNGIAFKILVFMAGLATIDSQYYNAAKIDGASNFTIWRRITLPLLSPQILYITITSFIGSFKMYTGVMSVFVNARTTNQKIYFGGDGFHEDQWIPVVGWIYKYMDATQPGISSAASLILLGIILVITVLQFAASKKRVHY